MSNVQISEQLFYDLIRYFYTDSYSEAEYEALEANIRRGLASKLEAMASRDLYTTYKTARTDEEREQARQEYLDRKGIPASFRWSKNSNDK